MCGIAGCVVPPAFQPERPALERMAESLVHRGPDDGGIEVVGSVGLVNRRLAIVDPSPSGHQPMGDPIAGWWLTYNGEIFNHALLRKAVGRVDFRGGSDTETLLRALARWGTGVIPRLNGQFAFAALDLGRRGLLLVRDRFGEKPLYFARHAGALWFASEIRALLAAGVPARPHRDVLDHILRLGWANGPYTPVEGILRILPGTLIEIELDTLDWHERRWYEPADDVDATRAAAAARNGREVAIESLESTLRASVHSRLMADCPVGTLNSGGIDSSLVAAFARELEPSIVAFNAAMVDQPGLDESKWAGLVANHLGLELHTFRLDAAAWRAGYVSAAVHNEFPLRHASAVPLAGIAAMARDRGIKVLLSGEGADELFGGYRYVHPVEVADFKLRAGPISSRLEAAARRSLGRQRGAARQVLKLIGRTPAQPIPGRPRGPSAAVNAYESEADARALNAYRHHAAPRRQLEGMLAGDLSIHLPHLLNRKDKSTMQNSVETRVPFLDPDVVSTALNLPLEHRVLPRDKGILRQLARAHLPSEAVERPKRAFPIAVDDYFASARREFLAGGRLREVLEVPADAWAGRIDAASGTGALLLWSGEVWCRSFLDGHSVGEIEDELWGAPQADSGLNTPRMSSAR